VTSCDKLRGGA